MLRVVFVVTVKPLSKHCVFRKCQPLPEIEQKWDLMHQLYVLTVLATMRCRWLTMGTMEHTSVHWQYTVPAYGWVLSWQVGAVLV